MKSCTECKQTKALTEFYWTVSHGKKVRHTKCQICRRAQFKVWAASPNGKKVKRAGILRREYRLTEEQYEALMAAQGCVCAICKKSETKRYRGRGAIIRLSVDHDHITGVPRALLCSACNVGIGSFKENPYLLRAAADYLQNQNQMIKVA